MMHLASFISGKNLSDIMIKQISKKNTFLSIQATYSHAEIALFKNGTCVDTLFMKDQKASSHLIPFFQILLTRHQLTLNELDFIAIDKGPGAFTSLRTSIATVNGIAFTKKKLLVGVDGLDALLYDARVLVDSNKNVLNVSLLNAYNNDVYFSITDDESGNQKGCAKIDSVLAQLANVTKKTFVFVGNGASLHEQLIKSQLGEEHCYFLTIQTPSTHAIGALAMEYINEGGQLQSLIQPNYLKTQYFAMQRPFNVPQT
jgi:tRNA threonylcarbamoyladenosine biosynthesis protein TsaB